VKTLTDPDVNSVDFTPQVATVADMDAITPPGDPHVALPDDQRFGPTELKTYDITAALVGWKIESDQDFHIVIADLNDSTKTMIVEVPSIDCSSTCSSKYAGLIAQARTSVTNCLGTPPTAFSPPSQPMTLTVTGVGYFDPLHGQTGVAPNGVELHAVLNIDWLTGGCH
jgi:hypothetical protein